MARRLLNLRGVPDEEADALRRTLGDAAIGYYELPPTAFGISAGSIWIRDDAEWPRAKDVFDRFQHDHLEAARQAPPVAPFLVQLRRNPRRIVGFVLAALMILFLMGWPILQLWR